MATVVARDEHLVALALDRLGPGSFEGVEHRGAEVFLEDGCDFGVLARQHLLAADHQGHPAPNEANMCTNSTPVTPDPTTVMLFGNTVGG
ncbi:MAG: hypothetical protein R2705_05700 [Ilumatobacteraceae bacterium]